MPLIDFFTTHYILLILLTVATLCNYVWLYFNKKSLNMNLVTYIIFPIFHTIIGIVFVFLFAYFESGFKFDAIGNLSLYGGVFFMPTIYFLYALIFKIKFNRSFDVFAISLIITLFFARINCIIAGCCEGILIGEGNLRVPTREIELLYYALFLIFTVKEVYKNKTNGYIYPIYMVSYGFVRFIIEFLRESNSSSIFHIGHIWSLVSILIGTGFILYLYFAKGVRYGKVKEKEII